VRLLLDTHALLWFYLGDPQLSSPAMAAIVDPNNIKFISPAIYWEIAIKLSTGKYSLRVSYDELVQEAVYDNGFMNLPIAARHTAALISLPSHVDRSAFVEDIPIVSADLELDPYPITRIW
jgi:PIN domain nuclease of toxin-antitoxin system